MAEISHHFLSVEGMRLHWAEAGAHGAEARAHGTNAGAHGAEARAHSTNAGADADAPPLVLLHGLSNSCRAWSQVGPLLAQRRRVLMPDLPGHGASDRPDADYALHWYARTLARWLEALGIAEADVVGHSFGGGVAQMLLLERSVRIRRLVLVAPGGLGKGVGWWLRLASLSALVERLGQPFMAAATRLVLRAGRDGVTREEILELSRLNAQAGSARAFSRTLRDVIDWRGQRRAFRDRAGELAALPAILLVWGTRDRLIPIAQGRQFAGTLEGVRLEVFEGCGHYPHNECPEAFVRAVQRFLDDPSVPAARLEPPRALVASIERAERRTLGVLARGASARCDGGFDGTDLDRGAIDEARVPLRQRQHFLERIGGDDQDRRGGAADRDGLDAPLGDDAAFVVEGARPP